MGYNLIICQFFQSNGFSIIANGDIWKMEKLDASFYLENDVVAIAKALIGKVLTTNFDGVLTSGLAMFSQTTYRPDLQHTR